MYEIFEQLLQKNGYTAYRVCKDTGIPQSTIYTWKAKKGKISIDVAEKLAKYFGVTIDYLMGNTSNYDEKEYEAKNKDERDILLLCRKVENASEEDRKEIMGQIKSTINFYLKAKGINKED